MKPGRISKRSAWLILLIIVLCMILEQPFYSSILGPVSVFHGKEYYSYDRFRNLRGGEAFYRLLNEKQYLSEDDLYDFLVFDY